MTERESSGSFSYNGERVGCVLVVLACLGETNAEALIRRTVSFSAPSISDG